MTHDKEKTMNNNKPSSITFGEMRDLLRAAHEMLMRQGKEAYAMHPLSYNIAVVLAQTDDASRNEGHGD